MYSNVEMFLSDMLSKRKVTLYIGALVISPILFDLLFAEVNLTEKSALLLIAFGILLTYTSSLYMVFTFFDFSKIKRYFTLPISRSNIYLSIVFAFTIWNLITKLNFLIILFIKYFDNPYSYIVILLLGAMMSIVISLTTLIDVQAKRIVSLILKIALAVIITVAIYLGLNPLISISILTIYNALLLFILSRNDLSNLIHYKKANKVHIFSNYFLNIVYTNKVLLVNTFLTLIVALVFSITQPDIEVFLPIPFVLVSGNSTFCTIISGEKDIIKKLKILPDNIFYKQYYIFMFMYFITVNTVIASTYVIFKGYMPMSMIIVAIVLSLIESYVIVLEEKHMPILSWKTKPELWKNPRKYILPIIVLVLLAPIFMYVL